LNSQNNIMADPEELTPFTAAAAGRVVAVSIENHR
jgi:hypothetical protein